MNERRRYPRFQLIVKADYKVISSKDVKPGRTRNISAEGICFESHENFNIGTRVNLKVDLGDQASPVSLVGGIRWVQEIKGAGTKEKIFINGVKLIDIPESDEGRFLKYYCDKMVEKLSGYLKM